MIECSNGGEEIEKEACFVLGLLAIKPEHQHAIAETGALQVQRVPCNFSSSSYFRCDHSRYFSLAMLEIKYPRDLL